MPTYIICIEPSHIHISIKILIFNALSRERGGLVGTVPTKGRVDDDDEYDKPTYELCATGI